MPAQDLHIWLLHLCYRLWPATWTADNWDCTTEEFLHKLSETVSGKLICMLIVLTRVLTWLQFGIVTDFSGQMLTFDGHWHAVEVCSSQMNPVFNYTGQMADVCVSGLLMSTLWTECPMVAVGLCYFLFYFFISPLFNQVGKLTTSSHLQLRPGQDKAKQFDTYNDTELHME